MVVTAPTVHTHTHTHTSKGCATSLHDSNVLLCTVYTYTVQWVVLDYLWLIGGNTLDTEAPAGREVKTRPVIGRCAVLPDGKMKPRTRSLTNMAVMRAGGRSCFLHQQIQALTNRNIK